MWSFASVRVLRWFDTCETPSMCNRLCLVLGLLWLAGCVDTGTDGASGASAIASTSTSSSTGSDGSSGSASSSTTGSTTGGTSGSSCATLAPPDQAAGCTCRSGHTCTVNGCFGGYWCNTSSNQCIPPPTDCGSTTSSTSTSSTGSTGSLPTCRNRPADVTEINAEVRVDRYRGIITGPSGPHEDFDGTITQVLEVANSSIVDTHNERPASATSLKFQ